ncbi:MAG: class I SAM-dependent methyltransferase, partial [Pseudomonadota bacterium]
MKEVSIQSREFLEGTRKPSGLDNLARRLVRKRLDSVAAGQIAVSENGQVETFGKLTDEFPLTAMITINDPRFYSEIAFGGVIGSGEAFIHDYWSCDELTTLVRILLRNRHVLTDMNSGAAKITRPLQRLFHRLNRNTRDGSRRNISAHYDLGNDFYSLWLDETMMYSAAVFEQPDVSLFEASTAKLDRICRKLRLTPDDHVVEIGSGWGGFAMHAAAHYGCRVT